MLRKFHTNQKSRRPGFSTQAPLTYPFRALYCNVRLQREQSGSRSFDLNTDGVAHYGLIADLIADMQQHGGGAAVRTLYRSAEAYLRACAHAKTATEPEQELAGV